MNKQSAAANGRAWYLWGVAMLGMCTRRVLALAMMASLFAVWPVPAGSGWESVSNIAGHAISMSDDSRLILIVLVTGALGSYVHSATSFVSYVGNRRLVFSWAWWYLLRPFMGMALALIFYAS